MTVEVPTPLQRDIVDRLRGHQPAYTAGHEPLCIEAAVRITSLRLDLTRAREELNAERDAWSTVQAEVILARKDFADAESALSTTQAELAKAKAYTEVLDKSWCEIADRHLAERTAARNALSVLRARVVEVGKPVVDCWGYGELNITAMTDFVLDLSNLVKEVESGT